MVSKSYASQSHEAEADYEEVPRMLMMAIAISMMTLLDDTTSQLALTPNTNRSDANWKQSKTSMGTQ
jgi:hypothetical protein